MMSKLVGEWVGRKKSDPKPIVYHGCHTADGEMLRRGGIEYYCLSFYTIQQFSFQKHPFFTSGGRAFLDSGAFSFLVQIYQRRVPRTEIERQARTYMEEYAKWVGEYGKGFDFHVTFDYLVEAPVVYEATKTLRKLGISAVPVYHGDSSITWLHRYIDEGHALIGLSKRFFLKDRNGLRHFYDQVFNITERRKVACHGFACTGKEMYQYPWYSVDSTSLVKSAGIGCVWLPDKNRSLGYREVSVSRSASISGQSVELNNLAKQRKMDLVKLQNHKRTRVLFNAISFREIQEARTCQLYKRRTLF